jgi:transposase InsO family protein
MDAYSRLIIGWSINSHMRTELVTDALDMAITRRKPENDTTILHSDRGSQPNTRHGRSVNDSAPPGCSPRWALSVIATTTP